jgi:hypothetical protein
MSFKDFAFAAEEADSAHVEGEEKVLEFTLPDKEGGRVIYQTYVPTESQIGLLMAEGASNGYAAVKRFMENNFLPATYREIIERIADRFDPLGLSTMTDVVFALVEEAAASPTTESSTSTTSPRTTGSGSRANTRAKASTSSASRRAGSSS